MTKNIALILSVGLTGCVSFDVPMDEQGPPAVIAWQGALDARGRGVSINAAPRDVCFSLAPASLQAEQVWLLRDVPEAALVDLERPSTLAKLSERRVSVMLTTRANQPCFQAQVPLYANSEYAVVVAMHTLARVRISDAPLLGAARVESWPNDGALDVPPDLDSLLLRFDGLVNQDAVHATLAPEQRALTFARVRCADVGLATGDCWRATLGGTLTRRAMHTVTFDEHARDARDGRVPLASFSFETGEEAVPLTMHVDACLTDEVTTEAGCAYVSDRAVTLRMQSNQPMRASMRAAQSSIGGSAPWNTLLLRLTGLSPNADFALATTVFDARGQAHVTQANLRTAPPLADVRITEICPNPSGNEAAFEYVELWNASRQSVAMHGYTLSDDLGEGGDVLSNTTLAPGARALIVSNAFDPTEAPWPVPSGVTLLRVDASLARAGLSNTGEPLVLRDAEGHRISQAPAFAARDDECLVRVSRDGQDGAREAFAAQLRGPTPGIRDGAAEPEG